MQGEGFLREIEKRFLELKMPTNGLQPKEIMKIWESSFSKEAAVPVILDENVLFHHQFLFAL